MVSSRLFVRLDALNDCVFSPVDAVFVVFCLSLTLRHVTRPAYGETATGFFIVSGTINGNLMAGLALPNSAQEFWDKIQRRGSLGYGKT
jgi:hypothetical protein